MKKSPSLIFETRELDQHRAENSRSRPLAIRLVVPVFFFVFVFPTSLLLQTATSLSSLQPLYPLETTHPYTPVLDVFCKLEVDPPCSRAEPFVVPSSSRFGSSSDLTLPRITIIPIRTFSIDLLLSLDVVAYHGSLYGHATTTASPSSASRRRDDSHGIRSIPSLPTAATTTATAATALLAAQWTSRDGPDGSESTSGLLHQ